MRKPSFVTELRNQPLVIGSRKKISTGSRSLISKAKCFNIIASDNSFVYALTSDSWSTPNHCNTSLHELKIEERRPPKSRKAKTEDPPPPNSKKRRLKTTPNLKSEDRRSPHTEFISMFHSYCLKKYTPEIIV